MFRDDPIVWRAHGLAIGVFVFSLTAALAIGDDPEVSVVLPVVEVVGVLAVVALIRILLVRAFASSSSRRRFCHRRAGPRSH